MIKSNEAVPFVSVIVPVYKDRVRVVECLGAISCQTYPAEKIQVIVVDNDAVESLGRLDTHLDNLVVIHHPRPGSYSARNAGVRVAKGEVLAFTDSDCIPYPNWIENGINQLLNGAERIAGAIELTFLSEELTAAEVYEKASAFDQERTVRTGAAVTANMLTWERNFRAVGLFDESLFSGGDLDWGWRAIRLGIPVYYAENVVVKHPARNRLAALIKKRRRVIGGRFLLEQKGYKGCFSRVLFYGVVPPVSRMARAVSGCRLSLREKIIFLSVLVFVNVYSSFYAFKLLFRLSKPERQ